MADDPTTPNPTAAPATSIQPAPTAPTGVKPAEAAVKPLPPPRQPPSPERTAARRRVLDGLLVGVVLAFAFLISLFSATTAISCSTPRPAGASPTATSDR